MEIEGVVLAAGLSSRANAYKMTLEFKGKTIIENTIDNMLEFCSRVIVVGGYRIEKLQPVIACYKNVKLLYNKEYMDGMYSSVRTGIDAVNASRFFFTPGDYPMISGEVYQELLKYKAPVVIPSFEGRKGHPVLFETSAIREAVANQEYANLRAAIQSIESIVVPVQCRGVILDIDTMEDYKVMQSQV